MAQILHSLSYKVCSITQYIWIVYSNSVYIRHYGPDSLLLQCDDIKNRSILHIAYTYYLLTGCEVRTRKYKPKVSSGCMEPWACISKHPVSK